MPEHQRILMVMESLGVGGAEIAAVGLLRALKRRGHHCEVAHLWEPATLQASLEGAGIAVHGLGLKHRWRVDQGVTRLARLIRSSRPTVIHAQLFFAGLYVAASRPAAPAPRRIVTYQNLGYDSYPATTPWLKARKRLDGVAMRRGIDAHVAVSKAAARHYVTHLGIAPPVVIPNGIDARGLAASPTSKHGESLARLGLHSGEQVILCPARFVHEKGHRFLLEALVTLRDWGLAPRVILAGDGPLHESVIDLVQRIGLNQQVVLPGRVEHAELLELMRDSDLIVLPSTHEGFPVAVAEAAAVGTAVVASDVGGVPDLITPGEAGLLVPPGDPTALAESISRALGDEPLRSKLAREAQRRCIELCDISEVARAHEHLYRSDFEGATI